MSWFDSAGAAGVSLVPAGATWKYLDDNSEPSAAVRGWNYDDSSWPEAPAQFGYGDGDEVTVVRYGGDPNDKHITTFFRKRFLVVGAAAMNSLTLRLLRDDGAVVYLNGSEVFRDNMPEGGVDHLTPATRRVDPPEESAFIETSLNPAFLQEGTNLIMVEIHQVSGTDEDMSFDLELLASGDVPGVNVTRGPYLQSATPHGLTVRWRTSLLTNSVVRWGTDAADLRFAVTNLDGTTEHVVPVAGLQPNTKYFYAIGTSDTNFARHANQFFITPPLVGAGKPTRIWVIGDSGTGFQAQRNVRDAYATFTGTNYTDLWLMLGDNAYCCGTDAEHQSFLFDIYTSLLRETVLWPTLGNHETYNTSVPIPYFNIFSLPADGSSGGVPSGTENYYSFDYANIHFVCLDSMTVSRSATGSMATWLRADLEATGADWIIAFWHHPPYTRGSHNSDFEIELIEMRQNIVPILEEFGVDLVLTGHSHAYERSYLIDGHYGLSGTFNATNLVDAGDGRVGSGGAYRKPAGMLGARRGAIYAVAGSSGGQFGGGALNHPIMFYSVLTPGSMVLDISSNRLDAVFLSQAGTVDDSFTMLKGDFPGAPPPWLWIARNGSDVTITWPRSEEDYLIEGKAALESSGGWLPVNGAVTTNGRRHSVTVPASESREIFRLRREP